jgi:hypothetical protein
MRNIRFLGPSRKRMLLGTMTRSMPKSRSLGAVSLSLAVRIVVQLDYQNVDVGVTLGAEFVEFAGA